MRATESPDALISSIMKYLFLFHAQDFALGNVIASEAVELLELSNGHSVVLGDLRQVVTLAHLVGRAAILAALLGGLAGAGHGLVFLVVIAASLK